MQTRSRARVSNAPPLEGAPGGNGGTGIRPPLPPPPRDARRHPHEDAPTADQHSGVAPVTTTSADGDTRSSAPSTGRPAARPPPVPPAAPAPAPVFQLTQEALMVMLEDASTRAAAKAVADYVGQHPPPQPLQSPHRSRESSSTPEEVGPRLSTKENPLPARSRADSRRKADSVPRAPPPAHTEQPANPERALAVLPPRKSPFTTAILAEALPLGVKVEHLPQFDGTGDPYEHVDDFHSSMEIYNFSDAGYCKMFRSTLKKEASKWFNQLPAGSITNFEQLTQRFQSNFAINKKRPKTASYLFTVVQRDGEPLREYMTRFFQAVREVQHLNQELLPDIIQRTLKHRKFRESLAGKPPTSLEELMARADKYVRIEEALELGQGSKKRPREEETQPARGGEERRHDPPQGYAQYTPLRVSRSEALVVAEERGLIEKPKKLRENPQRLQSDKYCRFHGDRGHTTEDCYHLKVEIEKLIQRGYLRELVTGRTPSPRRRRSPEPRDQRDPPRPQNNGRRDQRPEDQNNLPTAGVIN